MPAFGFTEVHEMFRREVRNFAQKELAPGAKERAKQESMSIEIVKSIGDMGLLGIGLPEEYGGQPGDWVSLGVAVEEMARASFCEALLPLFPHLFQIALGLTLKEIQQEWVPPLIRGETIGAFANTEPECGSEAAAIRTRAVKDGNSYLISGEKTAATLCMQAKAVLLTANTNPAIGAKGVSFFLVPLNLPGIEKSAYIHTGCKPLGSASIALDNVRVPAEYLIGEEGKGFRLVVAQFDFWRVILCLMAVGAAGTTLDETIEYSKQRVAFGQPIAKWEGVSFEIAECATLLDAARMLCYRTLWMRDQGLPHAKEASMAKWWVPETCVRIIQRCMIIFGHVGYSEEYPIEQRLRDVLGMQIADGTPQIQKIVIAREILGREFLPY